MDEDGILSSTAATGVLANDTDAEQQATLTARLLSNPTNGTLTSFNADGSFTYVPERELQRLRSVHLSRLGRQPPQPGGNRDDRRRPRQRRREFTAGGKCHDREDAGSYSAAWVTDISVGPANETGQMVGFLVSTGKPALFASAPAIASDGTLHFTTAADANGVATVTVSLMDNGGGRIPAPATFTITINSVNDAPIVANDAIITDEDTPVTCAVLANDRPGPLSATDEANQTLVITHLNNVEVGVGDVVATTHGTVVLNADGTVTYRPEANYNGSDSFSYTVQDSGAAPETPRRAAWSRSTR